MKKEMCCSGEQPWYYIRHQPDEVTCGPTTLHSVYKYHGENRRLSDIIRQVPQIPGGGTLAAYMGAHALKNGYKATIYTFNMKVFDPTWFSHGTPSIRQKLHEQLKYKRSSRFSTITDAYVKFLDLGGTIRLDDLTSSLIQKFLSNGTPIITGLSSTYLYRTMRETDTGYDDVRGTPEGHFVVLYGYDKKTRKVFVADPYCPKQLNKSKYYTVDLSRLVCSILLGVLSDDANLLIIQKKEDTDGINNRNGQPEQLAVKTNRSQTHKREGVPDKS